MTITNKELERLLEAKGGTYDLMCLRAAALSIAQELLAARKALTEIDRVLPGFAPGAAVLLDEVTGGLASAIVQCKFHARNVLAQQGVDDR